MGDVELRVGPLVTQAREGLSGGQADELDGYLGINLLKFGLHPPRTTEFAACTVD